MNKSQLSEQVLSEVLAPLWCGLAGEELRICYIDASMDHDARQNVLLGGFGFKCSCHRCLSGD